MKKNKVKSELIQIVVWLLLIIATSVLGGVIVMLGMSWYSSLNFPTEWVPNALFGIMWTIIYCSMGVYVVLNVKNKKFDLGAKVLLGINLALNIVWNIAFFGLNSSLWGLIVIIVNLIASVLWVVYLQKQKQIWVYVFLIYVAWLSIAMFLNAAIWIAN